jgi:quercetin dioxygenase-like cupin family protein
MLARIEVLKACNVPQHHHVNEQITFILKGAMRLMLGQEEFIVRAGEVVIIPPNLPHSGEAFEDTMGSISSLHLAPTG